MSDYAKATGAPASIVLFGKEYKVFKLRPRDVGELEQWFKAATPNPRKEAREYMAGLPDAVAMHIWDRACEQPWPPAYGSDRGHELMMSPEGQARSLHIVLRRGFAEGLFTLDMARDLADSLEAEDYLRIASLVSPGDPDDPLRASAGTTGAETETTTAPRPAG